MIEIRYWKKETEFELYVDGHAGYAEFGHDIVCAAVSALLQALCARLSDVMDRPRFTLAAGNAHVEGRGREAMDAFETILCGFHAAEKSFPHYIRLQEVFSAGDGHITLRRREDAGNGMVGYESP